MSVCAPSFLLCVCHLLQKVSFFLVSVVSTSPQGETFKNPKKAKCERVSDRAGTNGK